MHYISGTFHGTFHTPHPPECEFCFIIPCICCYIGLLLWRVTINIEQQQCTPRTNTNTWKDSRRQIKQYFHLSFYIREKNYWHPVYHLLRWLYLKQPHVLYKVLPGHTEQMKRVHAELSGKYFSSFVIANTSKRSYSFGGG